MPTSPILTCCLCGLIAFCSIGCAPTATHLQLPRDCVTGHVIVAPGTAGYWPDRPRLVQQLDDFGIPNTTVKTSHAHLMARQLCAAYNAGKISEPILLVGYSAGVRTCVEMAASLAAENVPVTAMLVMEGGKRFTVPSNVRHCFNLYTSNPLTDPIPILRGLPVKAASQQTQLINWDARQGGPPSLCRLSHLNYGRSEEVRHILVSRIVAAFGQNQPVHSCTEQLRVCQMNENAGYSHE